MNISFKSDIGIGGFYDVLPKELTIDKILDKLYDRSCDTLFKEIKLKPYEEDAETKNLINELSEIKPILHKGNWQNVIFRKFCDIVEMNFADNAVVSHSSGFDSRMISLAMVKRGLKPIEYCEGYGEWDSFIQIMKLLKIKNYRIFNKEAKPEEHSLPYITDPVSGFEGVVDLHLNVFYTPYNENITQFCGVGANTLTEAMKLYDNYFSKQAGIKQGMSPGQRIRKALDWIYYTQLNRYKIAGRPATPFNNYEFIKTIAKIKNWQVNRERFSEQILNAVNPDLARIPRIEPQELTNRGFRNVSQRIMKDIEARYKDSWYGKHVKSKPTGQLEYHQWWADWGASQICEYLIKQGYNIKFIF